MKLLLRRYIYWVFLNTDNSFINLVLYFSNYIFFNTPSPLLTTYPLTYHRFSAFHDRNSNCDVFFYSLSVCVLYWHFRINLFALCKQTRRFETLSAVIACCILSSANMKFRRASLFAIKSTHFDAARRFFSIKNHRVSVSNNRLWGC